MRSDTQVRAASPRRVAVIIEGTARFYGFEPSDLTGPSHEPDYSHVRAIAMKLCREMTGASYPQIGRAFGGRHHSTVMEAIAKLDVNTGQACRQSLSAVNVGSGIDAAIGMLA